MLAPWTLIPGSLPARTCSALCFSNTSPLVGAGGGGGHQGKVLGKPHFQLLIFKAPLVLSITFKAISIWPQADFAGPLAGVCLHGLCAVATPVSVTLSRVYFRPCLSTCRKAFSASVDQKSLCSLRPSPDATFSTTAALSSRETEGSFLSVTTPCFVSLVSCCVRLCH